MDTINMDAEINKKRKIIYDNNDFVCEYCEIIKILNDNHCKYTSNRNGIFLNLTTTSDDVIEKIYPFFINNTLQNYDTMNYTEEIQMDDSNIIPEYSQKKLTTIKETYTIPDNEFSTDELKIIRESFGYHL